MSESRRTMTVPRFISAKRAGQKLTMLTAYDYSMARVVDEAGVDSVLVGDSLAMVMQGQPNTLPVTVDEIIYHTKCVCRAVQYALVIADLPFPVNHLGVHKTIELSARILKETGCHAVKLEGGADQGSVIEGLVRAGIPVMGHVGLRPQNVLMMGGYRVQRDGETLLADAQAAQDAGAFGIVLEGIPSSLAKMVTDQLLIPTIGIGAGPECDGQVLVLHDMLGLTSGPVPKFAKAFCNLRETVGNAVQRYCEDVRSGSFPDEQHSYQ
ncbi:MAG: 3-methyl-2-oxobutanoate hydroxymethyltransferase [Pirellulaceae bacterium]|nr:3-methyl-2-oxobutanoate hydroxymethyltransferase [Pirellulaceae bacterium]